MVPGTARRNVRRVNVAAGNFTLQFGNKGTHGWNRTDLPPKPANDPSEDDTSFSGALGMTFAGAAWVAVFAAVGVAVLWALVHWLR